MIDQDAVPRKIRAYVALPLVWKGETVEYPASLINLSLSGCFLSTRGKAHADEIVTLRVNLPEGQDLNLRGRVTRLQEHPAGFGINFLEIDEKARVAISLLIAESNEKPKTM